MPYELGSGSGWTFLGEWNNNTGSITVPAYTYTGGYARVNTTWATATNATTYNVNFTSSTYGWTNLGALRDGGGAVAPEVVEARNRAREERDRVHAERRRSLVLATNRADALLLSLLSEEQQQAYRQHGSFEVIGSAGGRYRINQGSVGNVEWIDEDDRAGGRLCAHPDMDEDWLPNGDVALAQLLALTTDERAFVGVANVHAGRRPPLLERAA